MTNTRVELELDGQPITLLADSGSHATTVISGDWYEHLYGKGSCKYVVSGCYFCPASDPCNLESLSNAEVNEIGYGDGKIVHFSTRTVSLKVGKTVLNDFTVGLIINSTAVRRNEQPFAILGLDMKLEVLANSADRKLSTQLTFLDQLVYAGVIARNTFAIYASDHNQGINGQLVIGGQARENQAKGEVMALPFWTDRVSSQLAFDVRAAEAVATTTNEIQRIDFANEGKRLRAFLDTGATATVLDEAIFKLMWKAIETEFGSKNVDASMSSSDPTEFTDRKELSVCICYDGSLWIRKKLINRLPVIKLEVNSEPHISIVHLSLRNHIQACQSGWCIISVQHYLPVDHTGDFIILGEHFFLQYDTHIDLSKKVVSLSLPKRPVKVRYQSVAEYNEHHYPVCRNVGKRQAGMSWLVRSCFGLNGES
ncbi:hypothetical protein FOL47_009315 [Perkinsus chesapeaki]|uniref:Peptidase A2 domain-containing protein n=1 Tax=Perkinsus chesapeaki TaxID=330153 RepID=A0A7J6L939_PERCH|nr:hypothetical protein FOL47_009315 [Perkinsus chesapeaki]